MSIRAICSVSLTFGLVSIPVKLYVAAGAESAKFHLITPNGNRVEQKYFDKATGDEIKQGDCNKGYEYSKGQCVVFTKEEIKALEAEKSFAMEIKEFIPADAFDPLQVEKSYYLGVDKGGDKGYVLLAKSMKAAGKVAVAQWNSRGREHLVIVKPYQNGLVLHQMFYSNEVRDFAEVEGKVAKCTFHEVEESMATKLIEQLSSDKYDPSKYTDGFSARVLEAVEQKVNGEEVIVAAPQQKTNVVDLMAALKASLDATTKKK